MFFANCAEPYPFVDRVPQGIVISEAVARRLNLSDKALARARAMVNHKVDEVDWDVSASSHPVFVSDRFPFWTGRSQCVGTTSKDDVFYALVNRGRQPIWGRFVRNREGEMSCHQTVILRPVGETPHLVGWRVVAAYVGQWAPPFPGDPYATKSSREYWLKHALVEGAVRYEKGTEEVECPW